MVLGVAAVAAVAALGSIALLAVLFVAWWVWAALATDVHPLIRLADRYIRVCFALLPRSAAIAAVRARTFTSTAPRSSGGVRVADFEAAGVPMRVYDPDGPPGSRWPVLIWIHGGGWVIGSARSLQTDITGKSLARRGFVVLAVEYRLAPEHPFPAGLEDCEAAVRWVLSESAESAPQLANADLSSVCVGGDSAGANLAAVVASLLRGDGQSGTRRRLCAQVLVYPAFFLSELNSEKTIGGSARLLPDSLIMTFFSSLLGGDKLPDGTPPEHSPLTNPLAAEGGLAGLPPAIIAISKHDRLRDNGDIYHQELQKAGVFSTIREFPTTHGFISFPIPLTDTFVDWLAQQLKSVLAQSPV